MFKRCSNCKHCVGRPVWGVTDYKCVSFKGKHLFIDNPFFSGWLCKGWEKKDGK